MDWFIPIDKHSSESQKVLEITDEVIRKRIQNGAPIVQMQNWGVSGKDDYKQFIQKFAQCEHLKEAHKISVHLSGMQHVRNFKVKEERSTDSVNSSVFDEKPSEYEQKPYTRTYRSRVQKSGFERKEAEKVTQRN